MFPSPQQMFVKRRILGELLLQARKERGLTLRGAAKKLGKSYTWISNTEKAQRNLNALELWIICQNYDLDLKILIEQVMLYNPKEQSNAKI
jgi:transcriptional regulator with XRE-family HTH domain